MVWEERWRLADLAEFQSAEWVDPVSTEYRGWKVYELPPNSQGVAALEMLNILETFPLVQYAPSSVEVLHLGKSRRRSWRTKICAATWRIHVFRQQPPTGGLISKSYARDRAALIHAG